MATNEWRTLPNGQIEVNGRVPTFSEPHRSLLRSNVLERWGRAATEAARVYGVPVHWVLGVIHRESGGNPGAKSSDGGYGLMQLTSAAAKQGHSGEELLADPELNIRLGVRLMRAVMREGDSLVEVASKYNAGGSRDLRPHPSQTSPWGYRETAGHITGVVTAANTAIELGVGVGGNGGGGATPSPTKSDVDPSPSNGSSDTAPPERLTIGDLCEEIGNARLELLRAVDRLEQATDRALQLHQSIREDSLALSELVKRVSELPCQTRTQGGQPR
jgi:hypothetical protein